MELRSTFQSIISLHQEELPWNKIGSLSKAGSKRGRTERVEECCMMRQIKR